VSVAAEPAVGAAVQRRQGLLLPRLARESGAEHVLLAEQNLRHLLNVPNRGRPNQRRVHLLSGQGQTD